MRTHFAKMAVLPSLALAMLIAVEPATHAQEYLSQEAAYIHRHHAAPPLAYDAQANPNYGFGPLRPVGPNDVVSGNRIIGRDPDPFIRGELLRHYDSGWPDWVPREVPRSGISADEDIRAIAVLRNLDAAARLGVPAERAAIAVNPPRAIATRVPSQSFQARDSC